MRFLLTTSRTTIPAPDQGPGPEGYIWFFTHLREAFPDLKVAPEEMVADEEKIAIAYTITGTHKGNFVGIPPTGKIIKARGMQIAKFDSAGKIVERWGSSDELGILKQIDAVKTPSNPQLKHQQSPARLRSAGADNPARHQLRAHTTSTARPNISTTNGTQK